MLKSKTVKTVVVEKHDYENCIKLDPTLLLKLLEFAREEAKSDEQLHSIVSKATVLAHEIDTYLSMEHYAQLIAEPTPVEE